VERVPGPRPVHVTSWAIAVCLALVLGLFAPGDSEAQARVDLRGAHERCARALVRIERSDGYTGSGWVAELGPRSARFVVTNAHVVEGETNLWVEFADGNLSLAEVAYVSRRIDLALLDVPTGIPIAALSFVAGPVARGERVVIGGHPGGLSFITSEGVVAGTVTGTPLSIQACGRDAECLVLDAEAEPGSSGGPVLDREGRVIGMLWGVYSGASFSIAIPAQVLGAELMVGEAAVMARAITRALEPPADPLAER
jgi:S1-C subfamily serine protease